MKRSRLLILAVALALGVAAPLALWAQEQPSDLAAPSGPAVSTSSLTGTVVTSGADSLVIRTDAGVESTFTVDSSTELPAGLRPGDRVGVDYHMMDGGSYHASRVALLQGGNPGAAAGSGVEGAAPSAPGDDPTGARESGASHPAGAGGDLPRTASPLPLFAVMGVLAIGAAFGIRAIFRHLHPSV